MFSDTAGIVNEGERSPADVSDWLAPDRANRYRVSVDEYRSFRRDGYLVVRNLISPAEVTELREHTEELMQGRLPEQNRPMSERDLNGDSGVTVQGLEAPPAHLSPDEKAQYFLRLHMLHRKLALHERYLLHPRVLDVCEVLIGPDVLALQTMLFLKPPGKPGQGWHQDSYYIPTAPDTLCGAWIAVDDCDELNGAMWFAKYSNTEPVYPPKDGYGHGDTRIGNIAYVAGTSNPDDDANDLSPVANRYDQVLVPAKAGDVVFFGGHVLHRSKKNFTNDKYRRSFVSHYCNARSFTQWGQHDGTIPDAVNGNTNGGHILARGDTHLPFAQPLFGTPCAAQLPQEARTAQNGAVSAMMGDDDSGLMGAVPTDSDAKDNH